MDNFFLHYTYISIYYTERWQAALALVCGISKVSWDWELFQLYVLQIHLLFNGIQTFNVILKEYYVQHTGQDEIGLIFVVWLLILQI